MPGSNSFIAACRTARVAVAALAVAAVTGAGALPVRADGGEPASIRAYPYPIVASPSDIPVKVFACGVYASRHRLHVGFSFENLQLRPMKSVTISVDLYDDSGSPLTTLDSTIDGTYSPGARIDVPIGPQIGKIPPFVAWDRWPDASSAVCYVTNVVYASGEPWHADGHPSFDEAAGALDDLQKHAAANGQANLRQYRAEDAALHFRTDSVQPEPQGAPSGWKAMQTGVFLDARNLAGAHVLTYVSLSGPGSKGPIGPSDLPGTHDMEQIVITGRHATTVCGNRPAEYLALTGTTSYGPQVLEAIKVRANGKSYVASYSHSTDAAARPEAEEALTHLCY